jgi:hypothetical protein
MLKYLTLALTFILAGPVLAHTSSQFTKGPHGGHLVDAAGGKQHLELVAKDSELTLYVSDQDEKPVDTAGGTAEAQVLVGGKTHKVVLKPAGSNTMKGTGNFSAAKGMRVILKTTKVGGQSHQTRLTPLN